MNCLVCGKKLWGVVTYIFNISSGTISHEVASSDDFCRGHISEECPACGWYTFLAYHTREHCTALQEIAGKPKRTEVPQAFYDAFEQEVSE